MVKLEKITANKIQKKGEKIMKNTKKIAFICIALNIILLLQLCLGTVMALDENTAYTEPEQTVEEAVIEAQDGEMQIMAAASCVSYPYTGQSYSFSHDNGNSGSVVQTYNSATSWTITYSATSGPNAGQTLIQVYSQGNIISSSGWH